jgi:2-polyprenyl-3-methyl-5-hydroxy-6-metoxy-1,4-benzoquinol methylase
MSTPAGSYIMGHTDHERRRLSLQARFLNPLTEGFFHRAGIEPGMRVLDLGCGVGEVSLIAARIVGPRGHVTGIDIDPAALETAHATAVAAGLTNVAFENANVADYEPGVPFDAVTGRLILVHTADPVAIVRRAVSLLRPGGVVALQECDFTRYVPASPRRPLWDRMLQVISELLAKMTPHANVGSQLHQILLEAGASDPQSRGECATDGDPGSLLYDWISETVRSLLPGMIAMGLMAEGEVDVDQLAGQLRDEAARIGGSAVAPMLMGVSARKKI